MTLDLARSLVQKYLKNPMNQIHSRESEVVLRALARELSEDEENWGLAGLLHDLDWEETSEDWSQHGLKIREILEKENLEIPAEVDQAISAHNSDYTKVLPQTKFDYALRVGETVTGLIYAYALMRPERLNGMSASSLNKKFKDQKFAEKVSRNTINELEKLGIERSRFFEIAIEAIQEIAEEIGL